MSLLSNLITTSALAAAFVAAPALARNVVADAAQITDVLNKAGATAKLESTKSGKMVIVSNTSVPFAIILAGCDDNDANCKSVQFYASFANKKRPSLDDINSWSRDHRWGRFYIDNDGDATMEFDVDLEQGGMSEELFIDNVAYWQASSKAFGESLGSK
ncbi:MAG: YbjN domain-containing protein [Novosphingobium sp.]|uniref:YbjN domain-containing protein n=1 Tax=Novosphingobium sp. TaxID=1874826 RepID=UPI0026151EE0|nr:YbjN domain-containing protein [Novosphingobium sp.]MCP5387917.1 YbjN domain-containing protein [Novosphingobium sp.]